MIREVVAFTYFSEKNREEAFVFSTIPANGKLSVSLHYLLILRIRFINCFQ